MARKLIVRTVICLVVAGAIFALIRSCGVQRDEARGEEWRPLPELVDDRYVEGKRTREFIVGWPTLRDYEKSTGKKITEFRQSPILNQAVEAEKLPPVAQRISQEPFVVHPLGSIGKYGGALQTMSVYGSISTARILAHDRDFKTVVPDLAKEWKFSDGGKVMTLTLRKGLRWSDGQPFTTDDIIFWYKDILQNKDLMPEYPRELVVDGELIRMDKVDEQTVRITAKAPIPLLELHLAHWRGQQVGFYACKHYMRQFHPRYVGGEEQANAKAVEAGFTRWDELFKHRAHSPENPSAEGAAACPTMGPYVFESYSPSKDTLIRNPYYWKIDEAGNQLPYIDRIVIHKNLTGEVGKFKLMNGEMDFDIGLSIRVEDARALMEYQRRGGYRALVWKLLWGSVVRYGLNLTHDDPVKRKLFNDRRFRLALSLAIDRGEINDNIFFGRAVPAQATVVPDKKYSSYFEDGFGTAGTEIDSVTGKLDPVKAKAEANRLLDEIGLTRRDSDDFRLGPDGRELTLWLFHQSRWAGMPVHELVREYWADIGIRLEIKPLGRGSHYPALTTGKYDLMYWHMDGVCDVRYPTMPFAFVPMDVRTIWGPKWSRWYLSGGQGGERPPEKVKELIDLYHRMERSATLKQRIEAGKAILRSQAENIWNIGTGHLRNVPREAPVAWDTFYIAPLPPEAFWFDDAARRNETLGAN
ncbi:MAG: ABC transporter substrate-binding protein [Planctomycetota bacterium]|jgi:peptide/nickel transport system substrate-binding protein